MWKAWFGPGALIVTIDISDVAKQYEDDQVRVRIGDQSDTVFLQSLVDEFGAFDAVLDDGSHQRSHILASMDFLYPRIAANGVYMVEDVHTAYWCEWDGGADKHTIVSRFKEAADKLKADYVKDGSVSHDFFSRNIYCISAYDSIIVFEKARFHSKTNSMLGDMERRAMYWHFNLHYVSVICFLNSRSASLQKIGQVKV